MGKVSKSPQSLLLPVPAAMVSCAEEGKKPNIITIAYIGIVCHEPPQVQIGLRKGRYSLGLIRNSGEFVVNIPTEAQAEATDFCGTVSGKEVDKFKAAGLTPVEGQKVKAPLIKECPVNLECRVTQMLELGSHVNIIGEIVAVNIDEDVLDSRGRLSIEKTKPLGYCMGASEYYSVGKMLGKHGFSGGKIKRKTGKK